MAEADETLSLAKGLIRAGRFDEAVALLESCVEHHPKEGSAWSALGAAYFELEDYGSALPAAQRAVELDPDNARAWCNFGTVLRKLGRSQEARQAQRASLSIEPDYERAFTELGKLSEIAEAPDDRPSLPAEPNQAPIERSGPNMQDNAKAMEWWKKALLLMCAVVLWPIGLLWGLVYLFSHATTDRRAVGGWAVGISVVMILVGALGAALTNPSEEVRDGEDARQTTNQVRQTAAPRDTGTESERGREVPQAAEELGSVDDREPAGQNANESEADETASDAETDTARTDQTGVSEIAEQSPASDPETRARERRRIGRAWLRYGKKQYAAQEYEEALHAFQKAESLGMNPQRWMDACEERIAIAEGRLVERAPEDAPSSGGATDSYLHTYEELTSDDREALVIARQAVREQAWDPSSVDFGWGFLGLEGVDSTRVARSGDVFVVGGRFRGQNAFGATVENSYSVTLVHVDSHWVPIEVSTR